MLRDSGLESHQDVSGIDKDGKHPQKRVETPGIHDQALPWRLLTLGQTQVDRRAIVDIIKTNVLVSESPYLIVARLDSGTSARLRT